MNHLNRAPLVQRDAAIAAQDKDAYVSKHSAFRVNLSYSRERHG